MKNTKKFLSCLLALSLTISLSGCSKSNEEIPEETTETITEEAVTVEEPQEEEAPEYELGVNLIPGGDFETEDPSWGLYQESGGMGNFKVANGQLTLKIHTPGSVAHGVQVYCGGFKLVQGGKYEMSFDVSSSVERTIQWRIQYNSGDYHAYVEQKDVQVGPEVTTVTLPFTMNEATDPAPRFCFNCGDQDHAQGLEEHELYFDNVSLVMTDASGASAAGSDIEDNMINVNQIGYRPNDQKRAVFRDAASDDQFEIVDAASGKSVYSGKLTKQEPFGSSDETVAYADFSDFKTPGTYMVTASQSGNSYSFTIADNVYDNAFNDALKMFYLQRCGMELTSDYADDFAHASCHNDKATIYDSNKQLEVSGGWHDAGDYGRYTSPAAKAIMDLILAYENYPASFTDDTSIPESGNGIPDVLDEARYELDWLLKMQAADGGVYHKVTGLNFDGVDMPQNCNDTLYVLPQSKTATGDFAGVMFAAARIYKDIDSSFADKCTKAAYKALDYYEAHINERNYVNPSDVLTGEYADNSSADEYLFGLCEGYKTTADPALADKLKSFDYSKITSDGLGWATMTEYAYYAYLTSQSPITGLPFDFKAALLKEADKAKEISLKDNYGSSIADDYPWGSNMTIANNGMLFLMANQLTGDDSYLTAAKYQLDYLFGINTTSYCFLTGYGDFSPKNPHHRPSQTLKKTMPGMLVGGPNSGLEDPYAVAVLAGQSKAHCYVDSDQSYSCNEITIYWNSPLIYLMAGLN